LIYTPSDICPGVVQQGHKIGLSQLVVEPLYDFYSGYTNSHSQLHILPIIYIINTKNIQRTQKLNTKRTNNPTNKWANKLNTYQKGIQMANDYMKKCSLSLAIKEMKI
jgi:hypothetical protein